MRLRHQLPVYSPVTLGSAAAALGSVLSRSDDPQTELEALLRSSFEAREVLLCASGTQALQLAIESMRAELGSDSIVALPAFSCFDVASAAVGARGRITLYDLDPGSLSPEPASLERALDAGARIVVVAPLYGLPVDWARVERIVSTRGVVVIEDAAQGHGAIYRGAPLGALGDISTLSFGRGKGWTGGSGGAVLFRRRENRIGRLTGADRGRSLRSATALSATWVFGRPALYGFPRAVPGLELGETVYHEPRSPESMSSSAAAALLASRDAAIAESATRQANARWLASQLDSSSALRPIVCAATDAVPGYLRFPVLAARGIKGFGEDATALGIAPSYPRPLARLAALSPLVVGARDFPGAARLAEELVTLPVHSRVSFEDRAVLEVRIRSYE